MSNEAILSLQGVSVRFGGLTAAHDVSLCVNRDQIAAIIGPNGAGKTTVFNCVTGVYTPTSGSISVLARDMRDSIGTGLLGRCGLIGVLCGVAGVIALNIQTLWDASINQVFVYGQSFNWSASGSAFVNTLKSLMVPQTALFFAGASAIGSAGSLAMWFRARHTPHSSVARGVSRTFQNIRLFKSMTALENILVGMHRHADLSPISALIRPIKYRRAQERARARAMELLTFVGLADSANIVATSLPYGYQRKLEIARALASHPSIILLDEPAAGMNPTEIEDLSRLIERIRETGVSVLLIEHHMKLVMGVSDHVTVLEYGRKISEGAPHVVQSDPKVIAAYLGDSHG